MAQESRARRRGTWAQGLTPIVAAVLPVLDSSVDGLSLEGWHYAAAIGGALAYGLLMFATEKWADVNLARTAKAIRDASADGEFTPAEIKAVIGAGVDDAFDSFGGETQTEPAAEYDPASDQRA